MYDKPVILQPNDLAEGIYTDSGSNSKYHCDSIYMNGIYQKPTYNPIQDGYKIGRGCEGCPAQNGDSCRFVSAPEEMNWDGDFRPTWEKNGHKPDEKGY